MSVMLFKLRRVEEDEADEIRALLHEHDIDFYETSNGRWGLGFAAIWLPNDSQFEIAKALIESYQIARYQKAKEVYAQLCAEGKQPTLWSMFIGKPVQVVLALLAVVVVALFALTPFVFFVD